MRQFQPLPVKILNKSQIQLKDSRTFLCSPANIPVNWSIRISPCPIPTGETLYEEHI